MLTIELYINSTGTTNLQRHPPIRVPRPDYRDHVMHCKVRGELARICGLTVTRINGHCSSQCHMFGFIYRRRHVASW
jgi:hypothetical protein